MAHRIKGKSFYFTYTIPIASVKMLENIFKLNKTEFSWALYPNISRFAYVLESKEAKNE